MRRKRIPALAKITMLTIGLGGCKRTIADLNPNEARVVIAFTVFQIPGNPCELVQKAAFTYGTLPNTGAATASTTTRLMLMSPTQGLVEVRNGNFGENISKYPGSKIWLELAKGRVSELVADDRLVVDSVMRDFEGTELRDASSHTNWIPMGNNVLSRVQPSPGHSATECPSSPARAEGGQVIQDRVSPLQP
jgi:hypothetical protein